MSGRAAPSTAASQQGAEPAEPASPTVAVLAPHPLLTVTLEREGADREGVDFAAGGQGVWVARTAGILGAVPALCSFIGGDSGNLLRGLLDQLPGKRCLVTTATASGCHISDRRSGAIEVLSMALSDPPSRHELDDLFSLACSEAIACGWLVITNPLPADALPLELYRDLVADVRANGCRTLVDLSTPRVDLALEARPDLVKLNDWELAEIVKAPVSGAALRPAAEGLRERGARSVIVTRGEQPALVLHDEDAWWLEPPRFARGFREGCGDAMLGGIAATWSAGASFEQSLLTGAAAGAANFLRHGIGGAWRDLIEDLAKRVTLYPVETITRGG
jgi:1-phosphofructokinase